MKVFITWIFLLLPALALAEDEASPFTNRVISGDDLAGLLDVSADGRHMTLATGHVIRTWNLQAQSGPREVEVDLPHVMSNLDEGIRHGIVAIDYSRVDPMTLLVANSRGRIAVVRDGQIIVRAHLPYLRASKNHPHVTFPISGDQVLLPICLAPTCATFSELGRHALVGYEDGTLCVLAVDSGKYEIIVPGSYEGASLRSALVFGPQAKNAVQHFFGEISQDDVDAKLKWGHMGKRSVYRLIGFCESQQVVVLDVEGEIQARSTASGKVVWRRPQSRAFDWLGPNRVITCDEDGSLRILSAATGDIVSRIDGDDSMVHRECVTAMRQLSGSNIQVLAEAEGGLYAALLSGDHLRVIDMHTMATIASHRLPFADVQGAQVASLRRIRQDVFQAVSLCRSRFLEVSYLSSK